MCEHTQGELRYIEVIEGKKPIILDHLYPSKIIDIMYARGCLSTEETIEIENQTTMVDRVRTLLRAVLAEPAEHLGCFMERVKDENKDLYQILMNEDQGKAEMINLFCSYILYQFQT